MAAQTLSKHELFDRIESSIARMIDILKNRPRFPTLAPKPIPTATPSPPISATESPVPATAPPSLSTASATPPPISPQPPCVLHTKVLHVILRPAQHKARFNSINNHFSNQNDILPTLVNAPIKQIAIPTSPTPSQIQFRS
ncbi:lysine-rich arabinogalactan protein 19-like [Helianthus annuus]|uniref:lysine-rich arabinogalactan protein 19-like n=1 Tax=Helianthus annuus TaxID=4232 RepID=UPI000B8F398F|nr:lysine-rich arabinogalactan protein 19-like [Helianthus annuus]